MRTVHLPFLRLLASAALTLVLALSGAAGSRAADFRDATAEAEVMYLLDMLGTRDCKFQRNGSWYNGTQASGHLRSKLDTLKRMTSDITAEQFVQTIASGSSSSGQPYWVQCAQEPLQQSSAWMQKELRAYRQRGSAKK